MDVILVLGLAVVATAALTRVAFVGARHLRRRVGDIDAELRPIEVATGVCGACDGKGFRIENTGRRVQPQTCYRCGGTGEPPS